jgi:hypothetical protein
LGGIIRRYRIDAILLKAFGEDAACDILALPRQGVRPAHRYGGKVLGIYVQTPDLK